MGKRKALGIFWRGQSQDRGLRLLEGMFQRNEIRLETSAVSAISSKDIGAKSTDEALIGAVYN